jgi:phosphoribosylformylglycinamidine synthase
MVAIAESAMAGLLGASLLWASPLSPGAAFFGESSGRVVVSLKEENQEPFLALANRWFQTSTFLGRVGGTELSFSHNGLKFSVPLESLTKAHSQALKNLAAI